MVLQALKIRKFNYQDRGAKQTTSYPEIWEPSDATFEFSLEVESNAVYFRS
jgi:hypothetical protein